MMRLELPGQDTFLELERGHLEQERSVRGSPDVGISGFCRLECTPLSLRTLFRPFPHPAA